MQKLWRGTTTTFDILETSHYRDMLYSLRSTVCTWPWPWPWPRFRDIQGQSRNFDPIFLGNRHSYHLASWPGRSTRWPLSMAGRSRSWPLKWGTLDLLQIELSDALFSVKMKSIAVRLTGLVLHLMLYVMVELEVNRMNRFCVRRGQKVGVFLVSLEYLGNGMSEVAHNWCTNVYRWVLYTFRLWGTCFKIGGQGG
jgi:hypothetical protein